MPEALPIDMQGSSALDEETARAEVYGLLAQLYYAPPSPELLGALRVAVTERRPPARSWRSPGAITDCP